MTARVVVIGDGVNELVVANYLSLARHDVTLVRQRPYTAEDAFEHINVP